MPMGAATNSLFGLSAFQSVTGTARQDLLANAAGNYAAAAQYQHQQHAALSRLLQQQQGKTLEAIQREGQPTNKAGMTRQEWLSGVEARIDMSEASQVPIGDSEMAYLEAQADEWEAIYAR